MYNIEDLKSKIESIKKRQIELDVEKKQLEKQKQELLSQLIELGIDPKKVKEYIAELKQKVNNELENINIPEI